MNLQSSWMLVRFIFSEPPRELPIICHFILCISWPWLSNSFGKMFYLLAYISGVLDIEDGICFYLWINLVWKNMAGIQAEVSIQPSIHPSSMCPSSTSHPSVSQYLKASLPPRHDPRLPSRSGTCLPTRLPAFSAPGCNPFSPHGGQHRIRKAHIRSCHSPV